MGDSLSHLDDLLMKAKSYKMLPLPVAQLQR